MTAAPPVLCVDCTLTFATRALLNSAARLHQRSSTFPLEARISLALALLGGRRSSCRHRPESVRYCGVLKLSVQIPGRPLLLATVPTLERFVRASRPGGFESPAGVRGYHHCDSVSGCAGLSGVRESALFRPARGLAPGWRASGVPAAVTTPSGGIGVPFRSA